MSNRPARPRLVARVLLALVRAYQLLLSPLFAGSCRYVPSCSNYAAEAVRRHGAVWGGWLGLRRLARCHPLGSSGFDPVPENGPRRRGACGSPGRLRGGFLRTVTAVHDRREFSHGKVR